MHYTTLHEICSGMYDRPVQRSGSRSEGREEGYMDIRKGKSDEYMDIMDYMDDGMVR